MKGLDKSALWAVIGIGLVAVTVLPVDDAAAQGRGRAQPAAPAEPQTPTIKKGSIDLAPAGMRWGMTEADVIALYMRLIDDDYRPLYQKAQAGPQMERIDAAVNAKKDGFRRSKVAFNDLPTGIDSTPLKGEYTYRNQETMLRLTRKGVTRNFFFIQGKLWKVYDEVPIGEGKRFAGYPEALTQLAVEYGVIGRVSEPDYAAGKIFREVDWQDAKTHLRVADRSGLGLVGLIYEDRETLAKLSTLRTAQVDDPNALDSDIESLIRPPEPPPPPPGQNKKPR